AGRPLPLREDEVKRMGLEVIDLEDFDIKVGNDVRVISGALENFIGVVESISAERQKVKVIVAMFGRQTPVELDFSQVEKL
ncbi:MAG: KOW motif-containing protein, partial [Clostridia bacterium]